jgi:hypothetical protein
MLRKRNIFKIMLRKRNVTDWKVLYRDDLDQDRTSRSNPSEEAALERARQLYLKGRAEIYRIEGPNGATLPKREIMRWVSAHRGSPGGDARTTG